MSASTVSSSKLELIFGPMFSGKSTELLRRIQRYKSARKSCGIIKYSGDTRYSNTDFATHDGRTHTAVACGHELSQVKELVQSWDVIGIDEGQFFTDLVPFVLDMVGRGKTVMVDGLDGTSSQERFGNMADLIPQADSVVKLNSVCSDCGNDAPFTWRTTTESGTEVIGGDDKYIAVCRHCLTMRQRKLTLMQLDPVTHGDITYLPVPEDQVSRIGIILAHKIIKSGWIPDVMISLFRGAVPFALILQETFLRFGHEVNHVVCRTECYKSGVNGETLDKVRVHAVDYIKSQMAPGKRALIVDDLQDQGKTWLAVEAELAPSGAELRFAVGLRKMRPETRVPDYYVVEVDPSHWIVLPHEVGDFKGHQASGLLMRSLFPHTWELMSELEQGTII